MAIKVFSKVKKALDPHFNYDEEFVKAVAEKNGFNEEQIKRFAKFCENFKNVTHYKDSWYHKKSHKDQQEILTNVIEGIKKYPHVDRFAFSVGDSEFSGKTLAPSIDGEFISGYDALMTEMNVEHSAMWVNWKISEKKRTAGNSTEAAE